MTTKRKPEIVSFDKLLTMLQETGFNEGSLGNNASMLGIDYINIYQYEAFGHDCLGVFLVPIMEGYAVLPYDEVSLGEGWEKINPTQCRILG